MHSLLALEGTVGSGPESKGPWVMTIALLSPNPLQIGNKCSPTGKRQTIKGFILAPILLMTMSNRTYSCLDVLVILLYSHRG